MNAPVNTKAIESDLTTNATVSPSGTPATNTFQDPVAERSFKMLNELLAETKSAVIALSGGVDSTLIATLAHRALGDKALAVTGISPSLSPAERGEIKDFCASIGLAHVELNTYELELEEYKENTPDRCFHCKNELYGKVRALADERGFISVFDGTHQGDLGAHRPSLKAAKTHSIRSPFVEAGLAKDAIRALAKSLGLQNHDRPAQPCLSSRIAYGVRVTDERLTRVDRAEAALRALGFKKLRVRLHDTLARVEVPKSELAQVVEHASEITQALKDLGFVYVTLDLQGMRSGSLLEVFS